MRIYLFYLGASLGGACICRNDLPWLEDLRRGLYAALQPHPLQALVREANFRSRLKSKQVSLINMPSAWVLAS